MIKTPDEVVSIGDPVEVYVLRVDPPNRRLTLSLKRTQPEPWDTVNERYTVGQVTEGTVSNLAPFGAFVNLEDGIEGLVHISDCLLYTSPSPRDVEESRMPSSA